MLHWRLSYLPLGNSSFVTSAQTKSMLLNFAPLFSLFLSMNDCMKSTAVTCRASPAISPVNLLFYKQKHWNTLLWIMYSTDKIHGIPIFPSLKSVWFIVSELFADTCHTIVQSSVLRYQVGVSLKDTNIIAAWNWQEYLELNLWRKHFQFTCELKYMNSNMSSKAFLHQRAILRLISWCHAWWKFEKLLENY